MNSLIAAPVMTDEDALRADIYALLAALCRRHPSPELLDFLVSMEVDAHSANSMTKAWEFLRLASERAESDAIEDEYFTLFIGITQGELTPFASWYLTGSLMEAPLIELRNDLDLLGFARQQEVKEPEDHISVLLEVMSELIQQGASRERQAVFYQRHIDSWAKQLFADMTQASSAVFYSAVGMLGEAFLMIESTHLQKRMDSVQNVHLRG
ncbi:MAG: molecular chaperone TorD family protein [Nitrincola sp.]|nr:molecular chaperone TorD family protein [Nitrincola sp.]